MQLLWLKMILATFPLRVPVVTPPLTLVVVLMPLLKLPKLPLTAEVDIRAMFRLLLTTRVQTRPVEWKILR